MQAGSIGKLHEILARSHVIIPDLETPYPDSNMAFELNNQSINAIIAQRQQQLDAALYEISSLETVIDCITDLHRQLVEKKEKITQSMDSHKRLVSALWRLPNEILSRIFIFCLPEIHKVFPGPASKLVSPMLLTRVCQRWREVAINMPSLWCKLRLDLDRNSRRKWQQQALYYNTWLRRSQARPLLLVVQCYAGDMAKIRNLLQPYGNQVSSLNIPFLVGIDKLLENLPTLQELILHRTAGAGSHPPTLAKSISRLPITVRSLKVLRLSLSASDFSIFSPVLARLTHLELSLFRLNEVFELLQLCPNLSSLLVYTCANQQIRAIEPFPHTNLQSLRLSYQSRGNYLDGLFNVLSLPNLRVLQVGTTYGPAWPHEEVKAFLARSNRPLERLILCAGVMTTDEQRAEYVALISSLDVVVDPWDFSKSAYEDD